MGAEQLFLDNLPLIEKLIAVISRRRCFSHDEQEDFGAWVKLRLIDKDYATLRKFRGTSQLKTYLTTVISHLALDFLIGKTGKWRPSAAAQRLGPVAARLEQMIHRDGLSETDATELLFRNFDLGLSRQQLMDVVSKLPSRLPRKRESESTLDILPSSERADRGVDDSARQQLVECLDKALGAALSALEPEDRLLLRMRFEQGLTVARISRLLKLEQRPLYARLKRLLAGLRAGLVASGLDWRKVRDLIGWDFELDMGADRSADATPGTEYETDRSTPGIARSTRTSENDDHESVP